MNESDNQTLEKIATAFKQNTVTLQRLVDDNPEKTLDPIQKGFEFLQAQLSQMPRAFQQKQIQKWITESFNWAD